jgi:hypothetical protein
MIVEALVPNNFFGMNVQIKYEILRFLSASSTDL